MRVFSHILGTRLGVIATISVVGLIVVAASQFIHMPTPEPVLAHTPEEATTTPEGADWQQEMVLLGLATSTSANASSSGDTLAMIGPSVIAQLAGEYAGMQAAGTYSDANGELVAKDIAKNVRAVLSYKTYTTSDITSDPDSSYDRMLAYRSDMQSALKPLLGNTQAEYEIYGLYMESGDASYLRKLQAAADNYTKAAQNALRVVPPSDAAQNHVDVVNALNEFSSALNALATHADDAIASAALLRSYNTAEQDVLNAFNKLAIYQRLKQK